MGLISKFEGKVEDTVEGAAEKMGGSSISPVQIAKKAERQMRREKMVGAGKQYAPTLYTVLVSQEDDTRLFGYYPTLAGETETYLSAKATELGLVMDGQPLVRFIPDENLKRGKFEVVAEMVAAPLVSQLREEEMEHYGIDTPASKSNAGGMRPAYNSRKGRNGRSRNKRSAGVVPLMGTAGGQEEAVDSPSDNFGEYSDDASYDNGGYGEYDEYDDRNEFDDMPKTRTFDRPGADRTEQPAQKNDEVYIYDMTHDSAFPLNGDPMTIGRESRSDIVIKDINVSRSHAEIRLDEFGTWVIDDLESTNGTYVNGRLVKSSPLKDADRITIGTTELEFQIL